MTNIASIDDNVSTIFATIFGTRLRLMNSSISQPCILSLTHSFTYWIIQSTLRLNQSTTPYMQTLHTDSLWIWPWSCKNSMDLESISQSIGDKFPNNPLYIDTNKLFLSILRLSFFPLLSTQCSIMLHTSNNNSVLCLFSRAS
jgi:hypothetical protein